MLTPLFKKSKHVGIVEFLVTVAFGFVGLLIVLVESFPKSLVWLLSPFCQCTFLIGIAQVGGIFMLLSLTVVFSASCSLSTCDLKKKKIKSEKGIFEYWSTFYIGFIYIFSILICSFILSVCKFSTFCVSISQQSSSLQ